VQKGSAMALKAQFFFGSASDGTGFSETWWNTGFSSESQLDTDVFNLARYSLACKCKTVFLIWVRVQGGHAFNPIVYPGSVFPSNQGAINDQINESGDSLVFRYSNTNAGSNRVFLRGVPDTSINAGKWTKDPVSLAAVNALIGYLLGQSQWVVRAQVNNPQPPIPILGLTPIAPKGYTFFAPTSSFASGNKIAVKGSNIVGYNGRKTVVQATNVAGQQLVSVGGASPPVIAAVGGVYTARLLSYIQGAPNFAFVERASARKVGRFFAQPRGRARTVLSQRP
jgi:hypothetical protein